MNRLAPLLCAAALLAASPVLGQSRPACYDPYPNFDPPHPGACFQDTDLGVFLNLLTDDRCLQVETFGSKDDFLRWAPDLTIHSHQTELRALFKYCPPDQPECTCSFFLPSQGGYFGAGQFYVNAELDYDFNFTCPTAILGHGVAEDPGSGERYSIRVRMIFVPAGPGRCRQVANEIEVIPLDD
jgi:hypothetical protein